MVSREENLVSNWDWSNKHVQPRDHVSESRFVNAATVLISAGPPRLSGKQGDMTRNAWSGGSTGDSDNILFPIGVATDASIMQQRALQRIYEIGSDRCYFIQGRNAGQITLNRVFFNGANITRVLYAYYGTDKIAALGSSNQDANYEGDTTTSGDSKDDAYMASVASAVKGDFMKYTGETDLPNILNNPGYNNMYVNLASDLFNHPLGLMFMFQDIHKHTFASFYCEMCYVTTHGMSIQANGGSLIAEQVQLQFDRVAPVKMT